MSGSATERCMDCGTGYRLWWADSDLFHEVIGGWYGPSLLCPDCFDKRAQAKGIELLWQPRRWADPAVGEWMGRDVQGAIEKWRQSPEYAAESSCTFTHPHPGQPHGRQVINGVTRCTFCGNLDGSPECASAGCWEPFTEADLDLLHAEAMGLQGVVEQMEAQAHSQQSDGEGQL